MTMNKLLTTPTLLIEDDINKNIKPLLIELAYQEKYKINLFCHEQPIRLWKNVFKNSPNITYFEEFNVNDYEKYSNTKCSVIIDSINQMALNLGWSKCLDCIRRLKTDSNIVRLILVLHRDCLSHYSKLQAHLRHLANAIVSYEGNDNCSLQVVIKKNNKIFRSEEKLLYDQKTNTLKMSPVEKVTQKYETPEKPSPGNLTTFKIEVDQIEKMEKNKLKLPYMSKINEGESKVYYEPDAVDDWDEEDPDEDLDI